MGNAAPPKPAARFVWSYRDPRIAGLFFAIAGPTRSEARAAVKRELHLKRVPVGARLDRIGRWPLNAMAA